MKRIRSWLADEGNQYMVATAILSSLIGWWIRDTGERVRALESRGWVPVDDVATIGDLERVEALVTARPVAQDPGAGDELDEDPAP